MSNNLKIAVDYVNQYEGDIFQWDKDGSFWVFVGILICKDDLYYEMVHSTTRDRQLLSFVGIPESFGFEWYARGEK